MFAVGFSFCFDCSGGLDSTPSKLAISIVSETFSSHSVIATQRLPVILDFSVRACVCVNLTNPENKANFATQLCGMINLN